MEQDSLILGESLELLIDNRGKNPPYGAGVIPAVSGKTMAGGRLDLSTARTVSVETWQQWMPNPTRRHDLILTSEAPLGRVALVPNDDPLLLAQRVFGLRGRLGVLDTRFLYYAFQTDFVKAELEGRATGTTVLGIRQPALLQVRIPAPSYLEQRAIAEVLGALDDKIAANTKLAETADEYVRSALAAVSYDAEQSISLRDLITQRKTLVDPTQIETSIYAGLEHLPRRSMWLRETGTSDEVTSTKARFEKGDVLFGKLRPSFHKVVAAPQAGICSTDILVAVAKDQELSGFVLAQLASDYVVQETTAASEGTRMPRTSWKDLAAIEVPWPGLESARRFSQQVSEMESAVNAKLDENRTLAATRDALLPQLMSGKLRVKDIENTMGEMV